MSINPVTKDISSYPENLQYDIPTDYKTTAAINPDLDHRAVAAKLHTIDNQQSATEEFIRRISDIQKKIVFINILNLCEGRGQEKNSLH